MINASLCKATEIVRNTEMGFNIVDTIPIFGAATSAIRIIAAKIQACAGLIFCILGGIGFCIGSLVNEDGEMTRDCEELMYFGLDHLQNGVLNIGRGLLELASQICTLGIATLIYHFNWEDELSITKFSPICEYHINFYDSNNTEI